MAITEPFTRTFFFLSRWNSGYHGAFSRFFYMVESRLSRSLLTNFSFTWWNLCYHEAFSHEFFFHMVESRLSRSLFTRTFLSHGGISAITKPFQKVEFIKCTIWVKTLFIYITKSIYIGSASLKTLPLDLEPPLQGKEYGPPYCNEIAEKKVNIFVPEITYRFVIRILLF
jgi:hypothetical protein